MLHTYTEPLLGVEFKWSTRRDSVVTITGILPLRIWSPLTLKVQRSFLSLLFNDSPLQETEPYGLVLKGVLEREGVAGNSVQEFTEQFGGYPIRWYYFFRQIVFNLKELPESGPKHRHLSIRRSIFPKQVATITVSSQSLPLLKEYFAAPLANGENRIENLTMQLQAVFFGLGMGTIKRILKPARARDFKKQVFTDQLNSAYPCCRALVDIAGSNDELDGRIKKIVETLKSSDKAVRNYLSEVKDGPEKSTHWERYAACLVYWGFHGAWEKYDLVPLQDPADIGRQYIYGNKSDHLTDLYKKAIQMDPTLKNKTQERLKELYLTERGSAARAFGLL